MIDLPETSSIRSTTRRHNDHQQDVCWSNFETRPSLLAHHVGLPVIDVPLMVAAIGLTASDVDTRHMARLVDPARRSLGRFLAEEIAGTLGADFHI